MNNFYRRHPWLLVIEGLVVIVLLWTTTTIVGTYPVQAVLVGLSGLAFLLIIWYLVTCLDQ